MAGPTNRRECAHRLFAAEFNACRFEIKGSMDDRSPGYVISPVGAKANRIFLAGVLTEAEPVGEQGDVRRARISDPTGLFTVFAGQYQPEAAKTLAELQPPQYVAVIGKTRTYEPEPGRVFTSVRPEHILVIDEYARDHWILETVRRSQERIRAMRQALTLGKPTAEQLGKLGVPAYLVDGVLLSLEKYAGDVDLDYFDRASRDALQSVVEGSELGGMLTVPVQAAPAQAVKPKVPDASEQQVLQIVQGLAKGDDKGAQWDLIVAQGQKLSLREDQIEEALNSLMDKGVIYEPILGRLKVA